ncbi:MAG TPA: hypothetical protein VEQ60_01175, partial [Longimicrobium sp.]|nr:hypothetical protein [Longimicrobium sp.]
MLIIEPKSEEDIEAAVVDPEQASLGIAAESGHVEFMIQAKSRSTEPWTTPAIADVLLGKQEDEGEASRGARARPLEMLAADPRRRYVFVTNESLQGALRPHEGENLLDFPDVDTLPPHARKGYSQEAQASIAPRLLLCSGVTQEVLDARITHLLTRYGHVPIANHETCIREVREDVRRRLTGYASGEWTKSDLLAVLSRHGGSVLPTHAMDHYVRPRSYAEIQRTLNELHAVVIAGPSGTGKTLTAEIIETEFRRAPVPFAIVGEEHGPGFVRGHMVRSDPVLFHLRDPWGTNRLTPDASRWSDELPKLLRNAGPGRKFLITSRSDVLLSAGRRLAKELAPYTVRIEIEDYGRDRLAKIYEGISSGLSGHALDLARVYREKALKALTRPYEIDRFLAALSREDQATPRRIDEILAESQVDAISRVIADQIGVWGENGAASAAIIWALLSARGAVAADVVPKLLRRLRAVDAALRPDVSELIDFMVAGRNLRQDGGAFAFYHPRVEEGLRMAMLHRRGETEYVLSKLADALSAWDPPAEDWGVETVLLFLRALARTKASEIKLELAEATHSRLDAYLEASLAGAERQYDVERAFIELAQYGSTDHAPS